MGKHLGSFIRDLREKRGLSQGDVAKLLSLKTAQSISNIERGISPLPRAKIKRLAEVLGVAKDMILGVVLQELQDRYGKATGVRARAIIVAPTVSSDDYSLLASLVDRFSGAKRGERETLKKQLKRLVS